MGMLHLIRNGDESSEIWKLTDSLAEALDCPDSVFNLTSLDELDSKVEPRLYWDNCPSFEKVYVELLTRLREEHERAPSGATVWGQRCGGYVDTHLNWCDRSKVPGIEFLRYSTPRALTVAPAELLKLVEKGLVTRHEFRLHKLRDLISGDVLRNERAIGFENGLLILGTALYAEDGGALLSISKESVQARLKGKQSRKKKAQITQLKAIPRGCYAIEFSISSKLNKALTDLTEELPFHPGNVIFLGSGRIGTLLQDCLFMSWLLSKKRVQSLLRDDIRELRKKLMTFRDEAPKSLRPLEKDRDNLVDLDLLQMFFQKTPQPVFPEMLKFRMIEFSQTNGEYWRPGYVKIRNCFYKSLGEFFPKPMEDQKGST